MGIDNQFEINYQWIEGETLETVDKETFAEFSIEINGQSLTKVEDIRTHSTRDKIRISCYRLAHWITNNWWKLLWEPYEDSLDWRLSHEMSSIGGGYAWPNISFSSDGEHVLIRHTPPQHDPEKSFSPVRYLNSTNVNITLNNFKNTLAGFVKAVLDRIHTSQSIDSSKDPLSKKWHRIVDENNDPDVKKHRKLEALMGFDIGQAPDDLVEQVNNKANEKGQEAINEILAISKSQFSSVFDQINSLYSEAEPAEIRNKDTIRKKLKDSLSNGRQPWKKAEEAAKFARNHWGIDSSGITNSKLSEISGVPENFIENPPSVNSSTISIGFCENGSGTSKVFLNSSWEENRRFHLSRLIGDELYSRADDDKWLPATEARTSRQKFQRAFAQEFLCPYRELQDSFSNKTITEDSMEEVANQFNVSPLCVKTTLVNRGELPQEIIN